MSSVYYCTDGDINLYMWSNCCRKQKRPIYSRSRDLFGETATMTSSELPDVTEWRHHQHRYISLFRQTRFLPTSLDGVVSGYTATCPNKFCYAFIIRILHDWYSKMCASVQWDGIIGNVFPHSMWCTTRRNSVTHDVLCSCLSTYTVFNPIFHYDFKFFCSFVSYLTTCQLTTFQLIDWLIDWDAKPGLSDDRQNCEISSAHRSTAFLSALDWNCITIFSTVLLFYV